MKFGNINICLKLFML